MSGPSPETEKLRDMKCFVILQMVDALLGNIL